MVFWGFQVITNIFIVLFDYYPKSNKRRALSLEWVLWYIINYIIFLYICLSYQCFNLAFFLRCHDVYKILYTPVKNPVLNNAELSITNHLVLQYSLRWCPYANVKLVQCSSGKCGSLTKLIFEYIIILKVVSWLN